MTLSLAKKKKLLKKERAMSYGKSAYSPKAKKAPAKKKPVAKRARSMPLSDSQAKAAIQALRNDAGAKKYRKTAKKKK